MKPFNKTFLTVTLSLAVLGGCALFLLKSGTAAKYQAPISQELSATDTSTIAAVNWQNSELESVKADIRVLESQLSELSQQGKQIKELLEKLGNNADLTERDNIVDPNTDSLPSDETVKLQQRIESLDETLYSEAVDRQWADIAIDGIEKAIAEEPELSGLGILQASCGSTLCSLELSFNSEFSTEENMDRLARHRTWDGETFFQAQNDHVKLYFARDGESLPQ